MKNLFWFKPAWRLAIAGSCGLMLLASLQAQPFALVEDEPGGPAYRGGELLVRFKASATDAELEDAVQQGRIGLLRHIQTAAQRAAGAPGISRLSTALPVREAIRRLQGHPAVEFAEPNWVYTHQAVPNDPYFAAGSLWGMYGNESSPANPYGSQAAEAWAAGATGSSEIDIVVGIIDEGFQIGHPDLSANVWVNPGEIAGTGGKDDDGNGYVDDIHGWDFYQDNNSVYDGTGDDHGTHVAGTIGAVGGNDTGVVGVNWNVKLISGKFLGPNGGTTADAIEAVNYFTDLKENRGVNLVALNNSWGGGGYSQGLHEAIIRAAKADILFVAAAGNGDWRGRAINTDASPYYPAGYNTTDDRTGEPPASYDAVISVTAIDSTGNKASWANYGATTVDLGAPGVSINSTLPTSSYGAYSGTSMATPHVTGAIALYASTHPNATAAEIKAALLGATTPTSSMANRTVTGGRLDLSTVITPSTPLDPPPTVAITDPADGATVVGELTITATASDNGTVTQVEFFVGATSIGTGANGTEGWSISWGTTGVADGGYTLTAVATDDAGQTAEASVSVTVDNVDDPPTVAITSPATGATVSGTVAIQAAASDDREVTRVEFFVSDGVTVSSIGVDEVVTDGWSVSWDTIQVADVPYPYTLTAIATDNAGQTSESPAVSVTVNNSVPQTFHCGDLDATRTSLGSTWRATVTVTIHDASHTPVSGALVSGTWSGGYSGQVSGTTDSNGTVSFSTGSIAKRNGSVTFTVSGGTHASLSYDATANHDLDGDSNGTSITALKP